MKSLQGSTYYYVLNKLDIKSFQEAPFFAKIISKGHVGMKSY